MYAPIYTLLLTCVAVRVSFFVVFIFSLHTASVTSVSGKRVCELIHTARACLPQHLRFPPMFNLAERVVVEAWGWGMARVCVRSLGVTGLIQKGLLLDTLSVAYTHTRTHTLAFDAFDACHNTDTHTFVCSFVTYMRQKLYISRSNDACPTHKHTPQLCVTRSNDACSWGARYIHPAVPYIIPEPSVACDSSFDAP